jgi:hypothetical protein
MIKPILHSSLKTYRYEFLVAALVLLIFDKIFFTNSDFYLRYVWPANMVVIAIACYGMFVDQSKWIKCIRNLMSVIGILMPFGFLRWSAEKWFVEFLTLFYIGYYTFVFWEVMRQITSAKEVRLNVVIGSFCGYLLLSLVALFAYVLIELNFPHSFSNISYGNLAETYQQLLYFSFITLTSIGFGDIAPLTDMSRLTVAFFGLLGQFYMVAVIGIVISKFGSNTQ